MPAQDQPGSDVYRTIFEKSSDALMLLSDKGFFDCNPATLKLFGYNKKEEFCGKKPAEHSPPTQPDGTNSMTKAQEMIGLAVKNGSHAFEWIHRRSDGSDFPAEVLLTPFNLHGNTVLQATVRDITKQKEREAALEKMNKLMVGRELKMMEMKEEMRRIKNNEK